MRRFLQLALDLVDDLILHLLDRGARPDRLHDHDAEGEVGVFLLAHAHKAERTGDDDQPEQEPRYGGVADGPTRKVEGPLFFSGGRHRCCPLCCLPAPGASKKRGARKRNHLRSILASGRRGFPSGETLIAVGR